MLVVKNFGELQAIRQSFFANFHCFNKIAYGFTLPMVKHVDLLFMVVYSLLAYRHQACSSVVTISCISITN